jgi:hypothetical protein
MLHPTWSVLSKPDGYDAGFALQSFMTRRQAAPEARFESLEICL